jgi:hypothetical protein
MNSAAERIKRDLNTAERVRALVNCGLPVREVRKRVDMKPVEFEQFAARHLIALSFKKGE